MKKVKFNVGLNHATIMTTPLERAIPIAEEAGFEVFDFQIGPFRDYLRRKSVKELIKLCNSSKIKPVHYCPEPNLLDTTDDEFKIRELEVIMLFEILKDVNVDTVALGHCKMRWDYQKSFDVAVTRIKQLSEIARKYNIKLAFEMLGDSDFINNTKKALDLYNKVKSENVGFLVDTFHIYKAGDTVNDLEQLPHGSIFFVHISNVLDIPPDKIDNTQREYPSEGKMDLLPVLRLVRDKGYSGSLCVELFREDYWREDPLKVAKSAYKSTVKLINKI